MATTLTASDINLEINRADRYQVSVQEYITYRQQGFLVVPGLVAPEEIQELLEHTDDLMQGRLPEQQAQMPERDTGKDGSITIQPLEAPPAHLSPCLLYTSDAADE